MRKLKVKTTVLLAACLLTGSSVTALAQSSEGDGSIPAEFTGRWVYVETVESAESTLAEGGTDWAGGAWAYRVLEMSDPRMDGMVTISANLSEFDSVDTGIYNGGFKIENASGSWQELPTLAMTFPDGSGSTRTSAMIGEGDYEGLTAVVELAWDRTGADAVFDVRGVIIEGALPAAPATAGAD